MVYLPPPQLQRPNQRGYEETYQEILTTHRCSPLSSASSLIMLVAPDVDAVCAARMFADLLKQDDIMHRIIPVSGMMEFDRIRNEMVSNMEVRSHFDFWFGSAVKLNYYVVEDSYSFQYGLYS